MKITDVTVEMYEVDVGAYGLRDAWLGLFDGREWLMRKRCGIIVTVHTDEGVSGIGSAFDQHCHPMAAIAIVENVLKPIILGENPLHIEALWEKMFWRVRGARMAVGQGAIGGVDEALWDIMGKTFGKPLYQLLGGAVASGGKTKIKPYVGYMGSLSWRELDQLDDLIDEAKFWIDKGYQAIKFRGGRGLPKQKEDLETAKALRNEFGDKIDLMVDLNGGYTWSTALIMARKFEALNLFFMESPFWLGGTYHPKKLAKLAEKVDLPIHSGGDVHGRWRLRQLLEVGGVDIIAAGAEHGGGISEFRKMMALISAYDLHCGPHGHRPLGSLATYHAYTAAPPHCAEEMYAEFDPAPPPVLTDPPRFENGYLILSTKPGLGTDINEEFMNKYRVYPTNN